MIAYGLLLGIVVFGGAAAVVVARRRAARKRRLRGIKSYNGVARG